MNVPLPLRIERDRDRRAETKLHAVLLGATLDGADVLVGGSAEDGYLTIDARGGDDLIVVGGRKGDGTIVEAGAGDDSLVGGPGTELLATIDRDDEPRRCERVRLLAG